MADEKKEEKKEGQGPPGAGGPPQQGMMPQQGMPMQAAPMQQPVMPMVPPGAPGADPNAPPVQGAPVPGQPMGSPTPPPEPYGAQVLRRVHEDATLLLQDYDQMLALVEGPYVKQHLVGKLQMLADFLDQTEVLFSQEFSTLPPIAGAMPADPMMGNDPMQPGMGREEPTPEEALQGMELSRKGLKMQIRDLDDYELGGSDEYLRHMAGRYLRSTNGDVRAANARAMDDFHGAYNQQEEHGGNRLADLHGYIDEVSQSGEWKSLDYEDDQVPCDDCGSYPCECKEGEELAEDDEDMEAGEGEDWQDDEEDEEEEEEHRQAALEHEERIKNKEKSDPYEKVKESLAFLHFLSSIKSLDEEAKHLAYHHAMNLVEGVKAVDPRTGIDPDEFYMGGDPKTEHENEEMNRVFDAHERQDKLENALLYRDVLGPAERDYKLRQALLNRKLGKALLEAASFLKYLSFEKAFGDKHRHAAKALHDSLKSVEELGRYKEEKKNEEEMDEAGKAMVGELGEKAQEIPDDVADEGMERHYDDRPANQKTQEHHARSFRNQTGEMIQNFAKLSATQQGKKYMDEPEPMEQPPSPSPTGAPKGLKAQPGYDIPGVHVPIHGIPGEESEETAYWRRMEDLMQYEKETNSGHSAAMQRRVQQKKEEEAGMPLVAQLAPDDARRVEIMKRQKRERAEARRGRAEQAVREARDLRTAETVVPPKPKSLKGEEEKSLADSFSMQLKGIGDLQQKMKDLAERLNLSSR